MKLYYPITIDLYKVHPLKVMEAQQGNIGRGAVVTLTAGGAVVDPTGETVEVYAKKPDGTVAWLECSVEDAKIKIDFTNQMLMSPGTLQVELRMMNDTDDITTPIFLVNVNKSNVQSAGRSENELPVLDQMKADVQEINDARYGMVSNGSEDTVIVVGKDIAAGETIKYITTADSDAITVIYENPNTGEFNITNIDHEGELPGEEFMVAEEYCTYTFPSDIAVYFLKKIPTKTSQLVDDVGFAKQSEVSQLSEEKVDLPKDADGNLIVPIEGQTLLFRADGTTYYGTPTASGGNTGGDSGGTEQKIHGIVWDLVNVTSSNNLVTITDGSPLVAVLTPTEGFTIGDVTVTMGGEVLVGVWNADASTLAITSVTGDVVISCHGLEQKEVVENLTVAGYINSGAFPTTTLNGDGATYTADFTAKKFIDASLGAIGDYYIVYFGQEVAGGIVNINFDTALITKLEMKMAFVGEPIVPVFGTTTNYHSDNYISAKSFTGTVGELTINSFDNSVNSVVLTGSVSVKIPDGYYPLIYFRKMQSVVTDETIDSNGSFTKYVYDNVGITHTSVITKPSGADTLTIDEDYAQDYGVSTLSLTTEESEKLAIKTGLNSNYASVIETAKNEWLIEANGNINKIPLISHTDQHTNFSKPLWDTISGLVDWYDVGKIINLGDTVNSYVDSDTENPLTKCADLEKYISSMESVPYSKRIEIFGNHDTWGNNEDGTGRFTPQNYLYKYFRNIYARRFDNHGNFVTYDDNYNVKYVVVSGFAYDSEKGGYSHYIIPSATIDSIIEELKKTDGYDVVILSHVPLSGVNYKSINDLWTCRKLKTSGSVIDEYGVTHEFDFTSCDGELLCALHGHKHEDGCEYINDVLLSNWFDAYYISPKAIHFVLVDRENEQLNVWKVDDTPQYVNYQIPFNKPTE